MDIHQIADSLSELRGTSVQDHGRSSRTARGETTIPSLESIEQGWEKVVIRLETEVIKGFIQTQQSATPEPVQLSCSDGMSPCLRFRRRGLDAVEEISTEKVKAIFYVKDFEGDAQHRDLHLYKGAPLVHAVWIRVEFLDGEVMEGLVHNAIRFLVEPGFFLRPTDPNSNNRLVYVLKHGLKHCHVLGLRNI
jgi:hypothetical protein